MRVGSISRHPKVVELTWSRLANQAIWHAMETVILEPLATVESIDLPNIMER